MATERIRVTAEKFLVEQDSGYAVLRVRLLNGDAVRAVGRLREIRPGHEYELVGRYAFHASYGKQFQVDDFSLQTPTSMLGIERFLASGRFKGIGPKTAKAIVDYFGVMTIEVLSNQPERLLEVPGLAKSRTQKLLATFSAEQGFARLAAFMRGHGLALHLADKLASRYGSGAAALDMVQKHPYQMVEDVRGIGFRTADRVARAAGIAANATERMAAALVHVLREAEEDGHLYLPMEEWLRLAGELLQVSVPEVAPVSGRLLARRAVVAEQFGDAEMAVYSYAMYKIEVGIATRLQTFLQAATTIVPLPSQLEFAELSSLQAEAATAVFSEPLVILTGGPGTGKTTTVRQIVNTAHTLGLQTVLAAPTGRAAQRLTESTGQTALTLHRLLEVGQTPSGGGLQFTRGEDKPIDGDVLIVDEASMIDAPLFAHFLAAVPKGARLVLVGDPEQLPAVGPGQVLRDLLGSGVGKVFALEQVFRQNEESSIIAAAHAVRKGRLPDLKPVRSGDFFFISEEDPEKAAELVVDLAAKRLPDFLQVDAKLGVQVLSPMRKGWCGIDHLNQRLSAVLTVQAGNGLQHGGRTFNLHDKIMNIKNDYDREIFNGDIGIITAIVGERLQVRFGMTATGRDIWLERGDLRQFVHAYAISVHKSQGSEYPCVVMPVLREHAVMLNRQLLYTGMTRAKSLLVLVGQKSALLLAVRRADGTRRFTHLAERLKGRGGNL